MAVGFFFAKLIPAMFPLKTISIQKYMYNW